MKQVEMTNIVTLMYRSRFIRLIVTILGRCEILWREMLVRTMMKMLAAVDSTARYTRKTKFRDLLFW